jgi:hypothetical protein
VKQRFNIDAVLKPGKTGQFDVVANGQRIASRSGNWFTRRFGAGYPDLEDVVRLLDKQQP